MQCAVVDEEVQKAAAAGAFKGFNGGSRKRSAYVYGGNNLSTNLHKDKPLRLVQRLNAALC